MCMTLFPSQAKAMNNVQKWLNAQQICMAYYLFGSIDVTFSDGLLHT